MIGRRLHSQAKDSAGSSFTPVHAGVLQRKCACGGSSASGKCDCDKHKLSLQRSTASSELPNRNSERKTQNFRGVPPIVHEVLGSPSQPLDAETRAFMEPRFGHDFSQVRVHTDDSAAQSARAVNAVAYTHGRDIVFGAGRYSPHSATGQRLLAHELTHVIQQQKQDGLQRSLEIGPPDNVFERQADTMAERVCSTAPSASADSFNFHPQQSSGTIIQRYVEQPVPKPVVPPQPEPPVDCTKEITLDHDCAKLIGEMIALAAEIRDNDRWLNELNEQMKEDWQGVPLDVWAARTKLKVELQKKYAEKERIRAACCPIHQVPPDAPTYVPPAAP